MHLVVADVLQRNAPMTKGVLYLAGEKVKELATTLKDDDCDDDAAVVTADDERAAEAYQMRMEMRKMQTALTQLTSEVRSQSGNRDDNRGQRASRPRDSASNDPQLATTIERMYGMLDDFRDKTTQNRGSAPLGPEELEYLQTVGTDLEKSVGKISTVTLFPAQQTGNGHLNRPSPAEVPAQPPAQERARSDSFIEDAMHNIVAGEQRARPIVPATNGGGFTRQPPASPQSGSRPNSGGDHNRIKHI